MPLRPGRCRRSAFAARCRGAADHSGKRLRRANAGRGVDARMPAMAASLRTGKNPEEATIAPTTAARRNRTLDDALHEARATYVARRPKSKAQHEAARTVMPGGNTRTVLYYGPFPICAARGEGAYLADIDGHRYLNLLGEYTAGLYGHSHPVIRAAIDAAL